MPFLQRSGSTLNHDDDQRKKRTRLSNLVFCLDALDIRAKRNDPTKDINETILVLRQIRIVVQQFGHPELGYSGPLEKNGLEQIKRYYHDVVPVLRRLAAEQSQAAT